MDFAVDRLVFAANMSMMVGIFIKLCTDSTSVQ
jgi:hypothetical protein